MNRLKLVTAISFITTSLLLTACQKEDKGISDQAHQAAIDYAKEVQAMEYEGALSYFAFEESHLSSSIMGPAIPEVFKTLEPLPSVLYWSLDFDQPADSSYVKFVTELNVGCDNSIYYVQYGDKVEINFEDLIRQSKWRALNLKICGSIVVPEGKKLLIYAKKSSSLRDLDITTSKNALFSLTLQDNVYAGEHPKITIISPSVLKMNFY